MSFETSKHKDIRFLVSRELETLGIRHGFCGIDCDMRLNKRAESSEFFCRQFNVGRLNTLEQVHSNQYVFFSEDGTCQGDIKADAIIIKDIKAARGEAFGVLSADCLPLILVIGDNLALVHSGWRGLANGILPAVLKRLQSLSDSSPLYAFIGPAAGAEKYEVGEEVISAIGSNAVYKKNGQEKYLLNLTATAFKILDQHFLGEKKFYDSETCVISNTDYFSHRRQADSAGRNLTFVII